MAPAISAACFRFSIASSQRTGCDITNVQPMNLHGAPGVRIVFRSGHGTHTLYYFNADLSNGGSGGAVMNFCRQQGTGVALLKAASYLLHEESFSQCRNFLLSDCRLIVQDDSGIPYRYLVQNGASLRFFGHYVGTTGGIFAKYEQPDLAAAYAHTTTADLDFSLSYQWNPKTATILIATPAAAPKIASTTPAKKSSKTTGKKRKELRSRSDSSCLLHSSHREHRSSSFCESYQSPKIHRHRQLFRSGPGSHASATWRHLDSGGAYGFGRYHPRRLIERSSCSRIHPRLDSPGLRDSLLHAGSATRMKRLVLSFSICAVLFLIALGCAAYFRTPPRSAAGAPANGETGRCS